MNLLEIRRAKPRSSWKHEPVIHCDRKMDGFRVTLYKHHGLLQVYGRTIEPHLELSGKLQSCSWYQRCLMDLPNGTMIDGELTVPGREASCVSTFLANREGGLDFTWFAVPFWNHDDNRECAISWVSTMYRGWLEACGLNEVERCLYNSESKRELIERARTLGWEGFVLKNAHYDQWYKIKVAETLDVVVLGFKEGNGKYLGLVGALRIGAYINGRLVEIATCSGMDDSTRYEIDEKNDLGRVIEVEFNGWTSRRRLRHPRFKRWRDDKPAEECTVELDEL